MSRRGFTLVEVLVALTLSALVVLLSHRVLTAVVDGAGRVREARQALDRQENARRWLTEAFGSLAVGAPVGGSFEGLAHGVRFGTWLSSATRGFVPARVTLMVREGRLVAALDGQDSLVLADSVQSVDFDYLLDPGANARWVREWLSPVTAPVAVRGRVARHAVSGGAPEQVDTLLFLVGPRG
jgi:prepilin-type N-terminal cleavage/methylation domain-containing protein